MKKKLTLASVAAGLTLLTAAAVAMPGHKSFDPEKQQARVEKKLKRLVKKVDATEAQEAQIKAIFAANKSRMQQLGQERHAVRKALHALNPAAVDYQTQVDTLARRKGALVTEMVRLRAGIRQQVSAVLTVEQRAKMEAWHQ